MKLRCEKGMLKMRKSKKTPKTFDEKHLGLEPKFSSIPTNIELIKAFNWFNYFHDSDQAVRYVKDHLKTVDKSLISKIAEVPAFEMQTIGWIFRLVDTGNNLGPVYDKAMAKLLVLSEKYPVKIKTVEKVVNTVSPTAQDRVRAKTNSLIAELESMVDQVMIGSKVEFNPYNWMLSNDVKQVNASAILNYYEPWVKDMENEKSKEKPLLNFLKNIVDDARRIAINQKRVRKVRTRRVKPANQLVTKLKFKAEDSEYKLRSIEPTQVVGAKELWVFNTKKRILSVFRSDSGLSVKGTTILNWNDQISLAKKIRKPEEILKSILSGTKANSKRVLDNIKAKNLPLTGRLNSDTILVKTC